MISIMRTLSEKNTGGRILCYRGCNKEDEAFSDAKKPFDQEASDHMYLIRERNLASPKTLEKFRDRHEHRKCFAGYASERNTCLQNLRY